MRQAALFDVSFHLRRPANHFRRRVSKHYAPVESLESIYISFNTDSLTGARREEEEVWNQFPAQSRLVRAARLRIAYYRVALRDNTLYAALQRTWTRGNPGWLFRPPIRRITTDNGAYAHWPRAPCPAGTGYL